MPDPTSYKTIENEAEGLFKAKGSKFLAFASVIYDEENAKAFIKKIAAQHHKARHVCFAYRIGLDGNLFRANDAGEPSGTAGQPIIGQIDSFGLSNIIVVVVRYFGGTKLGIPGLIQAYREAAKDALHHATIIEKNVQRFYKLKFPYTRMNDIMSLLKQVDTHFINQNFDSTCNIECSVPLRHSQTLETRMGIFNDVTFKTLFDR